MGRSSMCCGLGLRYAGIEYAEFIELYELRAVLEGAVAHMAVRAVSEVEIRELEYLKDALEEADTGF